MKHFPTSPDKNVVDVSKRTSASASAVRDFRARMNAMGTGIVAFEQEMLQHFAEKQLTTKFIMPMVTIVIAVVSSYWIGTVMAAIWGITAVATYLVMAAVTKKFINDDKQKENLSKWRNIFLASHGLISLVWAAYVALPCANCDDYQYPIIQFSTILVVQAITAITSYAIRIGALMVILPASVLLATEFITRLDTSLMFISIILLAGVFFFHGISGWLKKSVLTMLEHNTTKEVLIAELETEKSISESARSRAEEANMAKSRFLATMSHELRTPLNAILGFSEIMRDEILGSMGNDTYREYVSDIHNSGSHLLKLINEILDISRIEAGKHELQEENLSLISIVGDAVHMISIKAKQKNVRLTTKFEENMPSIWVDERAIRQITLNLVSNALKFTPTGGEITIKVGWTAKGGQYISIKDTGPGIPEEEIPIVLSSFGQGTIAINNAEQGTGLGLTIVQALLQMHQGNFELKSKLREGTEAIAYLPGDRVTKIKNAIEEAQGSEEAFEKIDTSQAA